MMHEETLEYFTLDRKNLDHGRSITESRHTVRSDTSPNVQNVRRRILELIENAGLQDVVTNLLREITHPDCVHLEQSAYLDSLRTMMADDAALLRLLYSLDSYVQRISRSISDSTVHFCHRMGPTADVFAVKPAVEYDLKYLVQTYLEHIEDLDFTLLLYNSASLQGQSDPVERAEAADQLLERLGQLVDAHDIFMVAEGAELAYQRLSAANVLQLMQSPYEAQSRWMRNGTQVWREHSQTREILRLLDTAKCERKILQAIGHVDETKLRAETLTYGAKGANLEVLRTLAPKINMILRTGCSFTIPPFERIPTSLYERRVQGEDIREDLRPYFEWIDGQETWVRSSEVFSEDNEATTGADIYHSELLPAGASFEEFVDAAERVYASVDDPKAVEYRERNDIHQASMGIVLHRSVQYAHGKGHMNTVKPFAPGQLEVVMEGRAGRVIFKKDVQHRLVMEHGFSATVSTVFRFQPDQQRLKGLEQICDTADIGMFVEMHYGRPVQMEFLHSTGVVDGVQVRLLPPHVLTPPPEVTFPNNQDLLLECDAVGIGDMELDMLPTLGDNNGKKGFVVFNQSQFTTNRKGGIHRYLPGEGAVAILRPSRSNAGHIETLCVERGLLCLFMSEGSCHTRTQALENLEEIARSCDTYDVVHYSHLAGHTRVRVVADNTMGRVYPAKLRKPPEESQQGVS